MAHFAELKNGVTVARVLVVPDAQEHRGAEFLSVDLGLGGEWIQCSYNWNIRKQYPSAGYTYDPVADVFVAPQPFASWVLNLNKDWEAPVAYPEDGNAYVWDEQSLSWVLFPIEPDPV
jgi:hypothetical protein